MSLAEVAEKNEVLLVVLFDRTESNEPSVSILIIM